VAFFVATNFTEPPPQPKKLTAETRVVRKNQIALKGRKESLSPLRGLLLRITSSWGFPSLGLTPQAIGLSPLRGFGIFSHDRGDAEKIKFLSASSAPLR
jgi:hypothetical protein